MNYYYIVVENYYDYKFWMHEITPLGLARFRMELGGCPWRRKLGGCDTEITEADAFALNPS